MRTIFAAGSLLLWLLTPADSDACSVARGVARAVRPAADATEVPLNAHLLVESMPGGDDAQEFLLVKSEGGSEVSVPITAERLPFASQLEGRVRLVPTGGLEPSATYRLCHWPEGAPSPDGGVVVCPDGAEVVTFSTGTEVDVEPPPPATGLSMEVATSDFPDAGFNVFCSGQRRVRGIQVQVPDAGRELLYFARAGDAGIFSATPGAWLPAGIQTVDARAAGVLDCDGKGHVPFAGGFGVPFGTTALEVWTEDEAGNSSAAVTVPLQGDCSTGPFQEPEAAEGDGGPSGCGCSAGAGAVGSGLWLPGLMLGLWFSRGQARTPRRAASPRAPPVG